MHGADAASRTPRLIRLANAACGLALPVYLTALVAGRPLARGSLAREGLRDYGYDFELAEKVAATWRYDWFFAHPPPAVVLRLALADCGWELSALLWMGALVGSLLLAVALCLRMLGLAADPRRYLVAAVAVAMTSYFIEWDLRFLNTNSIVLGLVAGFLWCLGSSQEAPRWAWPAGFLLAAGIALKLYPAVFLGYLILIRRFRVLRSALLGLAILFIAVPGARFGLAGSLAVTSSWLEGLAGLWSSARLDELVAYQVSPQAALAELGGRAGGSPEPLALAGARLAQAAWLLLAGAQFAPRAVALLRGAPPPVLSREALMADASVLLLAPLPLSPLLQPHHLVLALPAALLIARWLLAAGTPARVRLRLAALCAGVFAASHYTPAGPLKGVPIFLILGALLSAVMLHGRAARGAQAPTAPAPVPLGSGPGGWRSS